MKRKYILAFLLFFVFVVATYYVGGFNYSNVEVKKVFENHDKEYSVAQIKEDNEKYSIQIYYPITNYEELNKEVNENIQEYIKQLKQYYQSHNTQINEKFILNAKFDKYLYGDYISFVFFLDIDVLGVHPIHDIFTITYDTKVNKIVKIEDLVDKNKNILSILSKYTYNSLKENEKIKQYNSIDMLKQGTDKKLENFEDFVFDREGLKIYFENYTVAPYAAGEFFVIVPYDKLK
ncbi:MAG: RsiV family protein [Clostridia bacterium]